MKWIKTGLLVIACSASLAVAGRVQAAEKLTAQEMGTIVGGQTKTHSQCTGSSEGCKNSETGFPNAGSCTSRSGIAYKYCETAGDTPNPHPLCNITANSCLIETWTGGCQATVKTGYYATYTTVTACG